MKRSLAYLKYSFVLFTVSKNSQTNVAVTVLGNCITICVLVLNRTRKSTTLGEAKFKVICDVGDEDAKDGWSFLAYHPVQQFPLFRCHTAADTVLVTGAASTRLVTGLTGVQLCFWAIWGRWTAAVDADESTRAHVATVIGDEVLSLNRVAAFYATGRRATEDGVVYCGTTVLKMRIRVVVICVHLMSTICLKLLTFFELVLSLEESKLIMTRMWWLWVGSSWK